MATGGGGNMFGWDLNSSPSGLAGAAGDDYDDGLERSASSDLQEGADGMQHNGGQGSMPQAPPAAALPYLPGQQLYSFNTAQAIAQQQLRALQAAGAGPLNTSMPNLAQPGALPASLLYPGFRPNAAAMPGMPAQGMPGMTAHAGSPTGVGSVPTSTALFPAAQLANMASAGMAVFPFTSSSMLAAQGLAGFPPNMLAAQAGGLFGGLGGNASLAGVSAGLLGPSMPMMRPQGGPTAAAAAAQQGAGQAGQAGQAAAAAPSTAPASASLPATAVTSAAMQALANATEPAGGQGVAAHPPPPSAAAAAAAPGQALPLGVSPFAVQQPGPQGPTAQTSAPSGPTSGAAATNAAAAAASAGPKTAHVLLPGGISQPMQPNPVALRPQLPGAGIPPAVPMLSNLSPELLSTLTPAQQQQLLTQSYQQQLLQTMQQQQALQLAAQQQQQQRMQQQAPQQQAGQRQAPRQKAVQETQPNLATTRAKRKRKPTKWSADYVTLTKADAIQSSDDATDDDEPDLPTVPKAHYEMAAEAAGAAAAAAAGTGAGAAPRARGRGRGRARGRGRGRAAAAAAAGDDSEGSEEDTSASGLPAAAEAAPRGRGRGRGRGGRPRKHNQVGAAAAAGQAAAAESAGGSNSSQLPRSTAAGAAGAAAAHAAAPSQLEVASALAQLQQLQQLTAGTAAVPSAAMAVRPAALQAQGVGSQQGLMWGQPGMMLSSALAAAVPPGQVLNLGGPQGLRPAMQLPAASPALAPPVAPAAAAVRPPAAPAAAANAGGGAQAGGVVAPGLGNGGMAVTAAPAAPAPPAAAAGRGVGAAGGAPAMPDAAGMQQAAPAAAAHPAATAAVPIVAVPSVALRGPSASAPAAAAGTAGATGTGLMGGQLDPNAERFFMALVQNLSPAQQKILSDRMQAEGPSALLHVFEQVAAMQGQQPQQQQQQQGGAAMGAAGMMAVAPGLAGMKAEGGAVGTADTAAYRDTGR